MNKSNLDFGPFDKQLCLREIFEVNYLIGKYNQRSPAPLMPSTVLVFSSEALNSGIKAVLTELFFKVQFVKNVLVYVFSVFTFSVFVTVFMRVLSLKLL